jgi:hypothetical protein
MTRTTSEKKNETEAQNTVEGHFSRLEQAGNRNSELKDKIEIKGKTEELFISQTTQDLMKGKCKNTPIPSKEQT